MTRVFLSCAPEDVAHRTALEKYLRPLEKSGRLHLWHDDKVLVGEARQPAIDACLDSADLVLLLLSADYYDAESCCDQMVRALARAKDGNGRVLPILLRPCLSDGGPAGALNALPSNGKPVTTWLNADEAWTDVAEGIVVALDAHSRTARTTPPTPSGRVESRSTGQAAQRSRQPRGSRLDDDRISHLAGFEDARVRRRQLEDAGASTADVDKEILGLKRQLRDGGQVRQGDHLGRYLLLQRIGRGGFATVWEAEDRNDHKRVALKVLHPDVAEDPQRRNRFLRGVRVMSSLTHHAVARILEPVAEDGGYWYFVMELLDRGDLQAAVLKGQIPRERVIPLILQVGEALAAAHRERYIHRDVKPANILLDADDAPKLTDFDLVFDEDTSVETRTGPFGTFVYAAPELLSQPHHADARADVFGLGMTTLFCLHGRNLTNGDFREPRGLLAELRSKPLADVLARAIEWEPVDRFADMRAFCDALRAAHAPPPVVTVVEVRDGFKQKVGQASVLSTIRAPPEPEGVPRVDRPDPTDTTFFSLKALMNEAERIATAEEDEKRAKREESERLATIDDVPSK